MCCNQFVGCSLALQQQLCVILMANHAALAAVTLLMIHSKAADGMVPVLKAASGKPKAPPVILELFPLLGFSEPEDLELLPLSVTLRLKLRKL